MPISNSFEKGGDFIVAFIFEEVNRVYKKTLSIGFRIRIHTGSLPDHSKLTFFRLLNHSLLDPLLWRISLRDHRIA